MFRSCRPESTACCRRWARGVLRFDWEKIIREEAAKAIAKKEWMDVAKEVEDKFLEEKQLAFEEKQKKKSKNKKKNEKLEDLQGENHNVSDNKKKTTKKDDKLASAIQEKKHKKQLETKKKDDKTASAIQEKKEEQTLETVVNAKKLKKREAAFDLEDFEVTSKDIKNAKQEGHVAYLRFPTMAQRRARAMEYEVEPGLLTRCDLAMLWNDSEKEHLWDCVDGVWYYNYDGDRSVELIA